MKVYNVCASYMNGEQFIMMTFLSYGPAQIYQFYKEKSLDENYRLSIEEEDIPGIVDTDKGPCLLMKNGDTEIPIIFRGWINSLDCVGITTDPREVDANTVDDTVRAAVADLKNI